MHTENNRLPSSCKQLLKHLRTAISFLLYTKQTQILLIFYTHTHTHTPVPEIIFRPFFHSLCPSSPQLVQVFPDFYPKEAKPSSWCLTSSQKNGIIMQCFWFHILIHIAFIPTAWYRFSCLALQPTGLLLPYLPSSSPLYILFLLMDSTLYLFLTDSHPTLWLLKIISNCKWSCTPECLQLLPARHCPNWERIT